MRKGVLHMGVFQRIQRYGLIRTLVLAVWWCMPDPVRRMMEKIIAGYLKMLDRRMVPLTVNGTRIFVDLTSFWTVRVFYIFCRYEENFVEAVRRTIPKHYVFVDIGANFGAWTYSLCDHFTSIIAVEPNPVCIKALKLTQKMLKASNVHIVSAALSNRDGAGTLYVTNESIGDDRIYNPGDHRHDQSLPMRLLTMDSLVKEMDISANKWFLKIDAQGVEPWIFDGMDHLLKKAEEVIIYMEIQRSLLNHVGMTVEDFLMDLKVRGFEPIDIKTMTASVTWDSIASVKEKDKNNFWFRYSSSQKTVVASNENFLAGHVK